MLYSSKLHRSSGAIKLILGILLLVLYQAPALSRVAAGDDALNQFVKSYGCNKAKALLTQPLTKAMAVWADHVVGIDQLAYGDISKDRVYGIIQRGHVQQALSNIGDMLNFIAVVEEASFGDPKIALRKASDWGIDYNVLMILGPKGAAAWGVMKTLTTFAENMNKEMLSLNVDMFGNYVIADPSLAGDNGGEIFLEKYLEWQSDEVHIAIGDNVRKMRGALIDYANIVLNQKNFPRVLDWKKPKYRNQIRLAARLMMQDATAIAKVIKNQKELKAMIPGLKEELAILQKFQNWYSLLKSATCSEAVVKDSLGSCLSGMKEAEFLLHEAERLEFRRDPVALKSITNGLDQWDLAVDRLAGELEVKIVEVEQLCRKEKDSWERLSDRLNRFDTLESGIKQQGQKIARHKTRICGADAAAIGPQDIAVLESDYDEMMRMADEAGSIRQQVQRGSPPAAIDFSSYADEMEGWKQEITSMKVVEVKSDRAFDRASDIETKAKRLLKSCPSVSEFEIMLASMSPSEQFIPEKYARLDGQLARLQYRLKTYSQVEGPRLNDLHRRAIESQSFINQRIERQARSRACLEEIPDIAALQGEGEIRLDGLKYTIARAEKAIDDIRHCNSTGRTAGTGNKEDEGGWSEGGYDTGSTFDGVIEQIHAAAQRCDYRQAVHLAEQVLAQDPDNKWVNANYPQLQEWVGRGERYQQSIEAAIQSLEQGNVDASLSALNRAMENASTQCGQDQIVSSLRDQAKRIVEMEREAVIEQARRESIRDAREKAAARDRDWHREEERRRTAESMHTIMTGIVNALDRSSRHSTTPPPSHGGNEDIVDHLVKENERKYGDQMEKWRQSNRTSIRPPKSPPRSTATTGNDSWMRRHPDDYPSASSSGSASSDSSDSVSSAPLPPAGGGVLPPATGGFECSGPKDWCDEQRNRGW
ncbi:MAG: hypothetical protein ABW096_16200 [Candidatus Thiodiazotropha sp.]